MLVCRTLLFVLALSLTGAAICAQTAASDQRRQRLAGLIPDPLPAQVRPQGTASFYTADHLYEYMDGGADIFLVYGVQMLLHKDLRVGAADIALDIPHNRSLAPPEEHHQVVMHQPSQLILAAFSTGKGPLPAPADEPA